jgi:hypothetical protein
MISSRIAPERIYQIQQITLLPEAQDFGNSVLLCRQCPDAVSFLLNLERTREYASPALNRNMQFWHRKIQKECLQDLYFSEDAGLSAFQKIRSSSLSCQSCFILSCRDLICALIESIAETHSSLQQKAD